MRFNSVITRPAPGTCRPLTVIRQCHESGRQAGFLSVQRASLALTHTVTLAAEVAGHPCSAPGASLFLLCEVSRQDNEVTGSR